MSTLLQDLKYGLRMLARNPGFTVVGVLTLALGIGANTAIFSVINGLYINPPGISNPGRLVALRAKYGKLGLKSIVVSAPDFAQIRGRKDIFASAAIEQTADFNYTAGEWPQRLLGAKVTWQWFDVFQARPLLGRTFTQEEDEPHTNQEAVLAYAAWKKWFGGDPTIVGRSIRLNEESYRVIGVMGPDFQWPSQVSLWTPLGLAPAEFAPNNTFNESYFAVARLRPNISFAQASAVVALLTRRVVDNPISSYAKASGWGMFIMPLLRYVYGDVRTPLMILAGAVGFVLLIACANIAGLLLARAAGRAREFAVRAALGAPRGRLIRQILAESLPLALAGAVVGTLLASAGVQALTLAAPRGLMPGASFPLDGRILLFTLGVTLFSALVFGIVPAWHTSQADPYSALKEGGRSQTGGHARQRLRSALVVGELALALVLLTGTGLLLKTISSLGKVNPGFEPEGVMTAALALPQVKYNAPEKQITFFRSVLERLAGSPRVKAAGAGYPLPFSGDNNSASFQIEGRPAAPGNPGPWGNIRYISPGYFATLGIPILRGRPFTEDDRQSTQKVAIIDEDMARRYWPNQDPIGQKLRRRGSEPWATIVGVVGNIRFSQLAGEERSSAGVQSSGKGTYYFSMYQTKAPFGFITVRTSGDPGMLAGTIRSAVRDVDPDQPVHDLQTMDQRIWESMGPQRFSTTLLGVFAAIAILLAAVGLYGVISYGVAQRTNEIGIRMALGARPSEVARLVLADALKLAGWGTALGIGAGLALTRLMTSLLYGVKPTDPLTFVAVSLILIAVALLACYIPARRAAKIDPMVALRYE
jgi:putative ABC transport system permease protein